MKTPIIKAALLAIALLTGSIAPTSAADVTLGALTLSGAFTRATLPNAPVGGGYLTITNTGTEDDRLVAATAAFAGDVQIHEMKMEGDLLRMAELADGLPIPAGETVTLAPGGYHLMFMQLGEALVEGTEVPVTLTFEKAGTIEIMLAVEGIAARTPSAVGQDMHSDMHGDMHGDMHDADHSGHGAAMSGEAPQ